MKSLRVEERLQQPGDGNLLRYPHDDLQVLLDHYWELEGQTFRCSRTDNSGLTWNIPNFLYGKKGKGFLWGLGRDRRFTGFCIRKRGKAY